MQLSGARELKVVLFSYYRVTGAAEVSLRAGTAVEEVVDEAAEAVAAMDSMGDIRERS